MGTLGLYRQHVPVDASRRKGDVNRSNSFACDEKFSDLRVEERSAMDHGHRRGYGIVVRD